MLLISSNRVPLVCCAVIFSKEKTVRQYFSSCWHPRKTLKPLKTPHRYAIGSRPVVLTSVDRQHAHRPVIVLKSWDHVAWPDGIADMGMMRFGNPDQKSNLPSGLRVPLEDQEEDLGDLTWDEETGRVYLLLIGEERTVINRMFPLNRRFGQTLLVTTI